MDLEKKVYRALKEGIFTFKYIAGQKLQYQDLADQYEVSSMIIKSVLTLLQQEGLVTRQPQKGYHVTEITTKEAEDLFEMRTIIELSAVEKAITNFNQQAYDELYQRYLRSAEALGSRITENYFMHDRDFHLQIAEMGGNRILLSDLKRTMERIFLRYGAEGLSVARNEAASDEHLRIYQAIGERDVSLAKQEIMTHLDNVVHLIR
ncbi:MAG: GntR family transcriptional regulator [Peptococcaceae bacterium]|nr:GntR family transcriptional regulator [Peptococcaceae bacterium]